MRYSELEARFETKESDKLSKEGDDKLRKIKEAFGPDANEDFIKRMKEVGNRPDFKESFNFETQSGDNISDYPETMPGEGSVHTVETKSGSHIDE